MGAAKAHISRNCCGRLHARRYLDLIPNLEERLFTPKGVSNVF
jgi:hypothetical protein